MFSRQWIPGHTHIWLFVQRAESFPEPTERSCPVRWHTRAGKVKYWVLSDSTSTLALVVPDNQPDSPPVLAKLKLNNRGDSWRTEKIHVYCRKLYRSIEVNDKVSGDRFLDKVQFRSRKGSHLTRRITQDHKVLQKPDSFFNESPYNRPSEHSKLPFGLEIIPGVEKIPDYNRCRCTVEISNVFDEPILLTKNQVIADVFIPQSMIYLTDSGFKKKTSARSANTYSCPEEQNPAPTNLNFQDLTFEWGSLYNEWKSRFQRIFQQFHRVVSTRKWDVGVTDQTVLNGVSKWQMMHNSCLQAAMR